MIGIHVFRPNSTRILIKSTWQNQKTIFGYTDYDIIMTYLSALFWKKHNGNINFYTDALGYKMFEELEMLHLYDKVDQTILEESKHEFNSDVFWAGAKMQVMKHINEPFVAIDMDLYVEKDLEEAGFFSKDIGVLHFEEKSALSYPSAFVMPGFETPENWNWSSYPVNCALLYFGNMEFKNKYVDTSLHFMKNSVQEKKYVMDQWQARMIFAEQRILGEMIDKLNIPFVNIIDGLFYPGMNDNCYGFVDVMNIKTAQFNETDEGLHKHSNIKEVEHFISHLWGFKDHLIKDSKLRWKFMNRLLFKFDKEFPNEYEKLKISLEAFYQSLMS